MQHHSFRVGDRVVTNKPLSGIPVGAVGTVVRVYISVAGCYDIRLDNCSTVHLMYEADLELSALGADD